MLVHALMLKTGPWWRLLSLKKVFMGSLEIARLDAIHFKIVHHLVGHLKEHLFRQLVLGVRVHHVHLAVVDVFAQLNELYDVPGGTHIADLQWPVVRVELYHRTEIGRSDAYDDDRYRQIGRAYDGSLRLRQVAQYTIWQFD